MAKSKTCRRNGWLGGCSQAKMVQVCHMKFAARLVLSCILISTTMSIAQTDDLPAEVTVSLLGPDNQPAAAAKSAYGEEDRRGVARRNWGRRASAFCGLRGRSSRSAGRCWITKRGRLPVCGVRTAAVCVECEISFRHGLAEFFPAVREGERDGDHGCEPRHGADGDSLRAVWRAPRPCVSGRAGVDAAAVLFELGGAGVFGG